MRKKSSKIIFFLLVLGIIYTTVVNVFFLKEVRKTFSKYNSHYQVETRVIPPRPTTKKVLVPIMDGDTYGALMATSGVDYLVSQEIYKAAENLYDLVKIRAGRELELVYDITSDELKEFKYKIDSEDELIVARRTPNSKTFATSSEESENIWQAEIKPIPYVTKIKTAADTVESSMYQAALDNEIDIRAIIELANAFQWSIDFAMDPRVGDKFKFIHEERYLNGEYVMPGQVLAGKYVNDGEDYYVYYFEESGENKGYFDEDGNSVQKIFLKAPVAFKYISSGYTTGPRYIAQFKTFTSSHMAIDYAASAGTPVRAVGNGTVTYAGWKSGGYGNFITLHHNGTYSTNYAHLSRIYVKYGQKVSQGDIIGAVGSTGFSTGPHLHYEMVKHGVKVNPLKEILPPGKPIKEENRERYFEAIKKWQEILE